jgi:hypothetical protein
MSIFSATELEESWKPSIHAGGCALGWCRASQPNLIIHNIRADISFCAAPFFVLFLEIASTGALQWIQLQVPLVARPPGTVEVSSRRRWAAAHDERCHAFALEYRHALHAVPY